MGYHPAHPHDRGLVAKGADFFQEEHGFEVSYYQKIQSGEAQIDDLGDDHSFAEGSAW